MASEHDLFSLFGGIRPMARKMGEAPSNVAAWKRVGRIPAEKQPHVLEVGLALGLPITAEHVVFPLGRPDAAPADLAQDENSVVRDQQPQTQKKDMP